MQSAVSLSGGLTLGDEVKTEAHDVRRDKTKPNQSVGLSSTMEGERPRYRGTSAGAAKGKPQEHQTVQSAVPEFDGPKLGNEAEAEAHDVRRDKTKVNQSAGISGTMEVERPRYAAWQAAGSQARPRSSIPTKGGVGRGKSGSGRLDPDFLMVPP